jgi:predicted transcriptional regulator
MDMRAEDEARTVPALATDIVVAYLGHHTVATSDIGRLVAVVAGELGGLGREPAPTAKPEPAVPVGRSVQRDHLVCLVCGKRFKSLRRHLQSAHQLTDSQYREMFGLGRTYPMIAIASTEQRVAIARRTQLGRRRGNDVEPETMPEPAMPDIVAEPAIAAEAGLGADAAAREPVAAAVGSVARPVRGRRPARQKPPSASSSGDLASQPQPDPEPETKLRRPARRKSEATPR